MDINRRRALLLSLIAIVAGSGCSASKRHISHRIADLRGFSPIVGKDGKCLQEARGIWHASGYGYVIEVSEDRVRQFNVCGAGAWEPPGDVPELLFQQRADGNCSITLHPLVPGYHCKRLGLLPSLRSESGSWLPTDVFDLFESTMTDYYPFFEERGFDWKKRLASARLQLNDQMSDQQLFDTMAATLENLGDGHVSLQAIIGGEECEADTGGDGGTVSKVHEAFDSNAQGKDRPTHWGEWTGRLNTNIKQTVLGGRSRDACNSRLIWGRTNMSTGYLCIKGMGGYGEGSIDEMVALLHEGLDQALTELADTTALIVDVSLNPGGMDLYSLEVASRFADRKRLGFSKWPARVKADRIDQFVSPRQNAVTYTKPIYLVTSDVTASAAEIFVMCMRAFPHVKTVGQRTSGVLSDVLEKTLPNGWEFTIANEVYIDHHGRTYEGVGIPPAVELEIFDSRDVLRMRHAEAILEVAEMAR